MWQSDEIAIMAWSWLSETSGSSTRDDWIGGDHLGDAVGDGCTCATRAERRGRQEASGEVGASSSAVAAAAAAAARVWAAPAAPAAIALRPPEREEARMGRMALARCEKTSSTPAPAGRGRSTDGWPLALGGR